jgi:putative ABC transport system permease protein
VKGNPQFVERDVQNVIRVTYHALRLRFTHYALRFTCYASGFTFQNHRSLFMLGSRWHKILNDLWGNKTRTFLIVLSITVGLFAMGTIASARVILAGGMAESFAAINPSSGTVRTLELFEEDFVRSVRAMRDVEDADARRTLDARIQIAPGKWENLIVFAVEDYDDIRVNKIWPQSGAWPPPEREILIERAALPLIEAQVGDVVLIETADERQRELRIAGLAHDPAQIPAQLEGTPYGYVSFETLDWFGEEQGFNELYVVARNQEDKDSAQQVNNEVKNKAEKSGYTIPLSTTAEPGQLPLDEILQAVLLLMGVLGVLSLFLSTFLIVNTVSALLAQQKRQIGVMKAIGARTSQIMGMYLMMVTIYGLMALIIAVPSALVGSRGLSRLMASYLNFDLTDLSVPARAVVLQIVVGLMLPVLASLPPFIATLRITAAKAMSAYRMGKGRFGVGVVDRLLSGSNLWFARRVLPRPVLLSLRNIFRRKGRLALTLTTLTLAGATFIGVVSVNATLSHTMDDLLQNYNFDSVVLFARPYRMAKISGEAQNVPGVVGTDVYGMTPARRIRADGSEGTTIYLLSFNIGSDLIRGPAMAAGRWLLPEDENALVVDAIMLKEEPDIKLGDEIVLKIDGRKRPFRVVGFSLGIIAPVAYANHPYIAQITGEIGQTSAAIVATQRHDEVSVTETISALEEHLENAGLRVSSVYPIATERAEGEAFFGGIIALLLIMAFLLAIVGGLGLMGAMSINVLERTREIGVLRAIGAPNRGVSQVFIREGIAISLLSWLLGALLAFPLGKALSDGVGIPILGVPLDYSYSVTGVLVWLVLAIILSVLASLLPARSASRLTVREVLAYE